MQRVDPARELESTPLKSQLAAIAGVASFLYWVQLDRRLVLMVLRGSREAQLQASAQASLESLSQESPSLDYPDVRVGVTGGTSGYRYGPHHNLCYGSGII